jgi:cadmium resistance protein CadD (predicted permease)
VAASAAAATLAWAIPPGWVALLGVVPLGLGLRGIARQRRRDEPAGDGDPLEVERATERRTHSQALAVGAVTVAHGGDNLGVYIPLFASDLPAIAVYATVFAAMTALWCALGHALARNRWIEGRGDRVARSLLPWVLVGLGIYILSGARALA